MKKDFTNANLEELEGSHVYVPDLETDYQSYHTGKSIKTINNQHPTLRTKITNKVNLPPFCTATNNPGVGSQLTITYDAGNKLLEVFTLEKYINSFIGHKIVRDVEYLAQEIAIEVATALGQAITVSADFNLVGFKYGQSVHCEIDIPQNLISSLRVQYPERYREYVKQQVSNPSVKIPVDSETFMDRIAAATAAVKAKQTVQDSPQVLKQDQVTGDHGHCPVKAQLIQEQATYNNSTYTASIGNETTSTSATDNYADAKECPFMSREKAAPGSVCPVTGKSYD